MPNLGGLLDTLAQARQTNPELFQAIGMGLLSGDMAGGFQAANAMRDKRLDREMQAGQFDRRMTQDDRQFTQRMDQDASQFDQTFGQNAANADRSYGLQRAEFDFNKQTLSEKLAQERAGRNATAAYLQSNGGTPDEIALATSGQGAEAFRLFQSRMNPKRDLETIYDDQGREQKGYFGPGGTFVPVGGWKAPSGSNGGITIGPDGTVQIGGGARIPANFMADPNNPGAVTPIPGGPGEQVPSELAARIGLADNFLDQAPGLRERIAAGDVTGPSDRFMAGNVASSDQANIYRQLRSGTDALMRMLTGAGMNETEARDYADRYLPGYGDDAASAAAKLDQLTSELRRTKAMAMRGRGGTGASSASHASSGTAPTQAQTGTVPSNLKGKYGLR